MTNILANHECAKHELFQKMHDAINGGSSVKSGEGAWAYVSTAIAEALGRMEEAAEWKIKAAKVKQDI